MADSEKVSAEMAMAFVHQAMSRIGMLESAMNSLVDDYGEADDEQASALDQRWSGWLWYLGEATQVLDVSEESPGGIYLKVSLADGTTSWADSVGSDTGEYSYYPVGEEADEGEYDFSIGRVVGDIRIEMVPWLPEDES